MIVSIAVLAIVALQRLGELALSARNTRGLMARGAREAGAGHYPLIVALHAAWLAGLAGLAWDRPVIWPWLGVFLALQAARAWTILSLGRRWTTRIIVLPGAPPVSRGPYRFLKHPNYVVVAAEIIVLPLAFGLEAYAMAFGIMNAALLLVRIRAEDAALAAGSRDAAFTAAAR